jgi:hypothetical protein
LDVLYGGLGIRKIAIFDKKIFLVFSAVIFFPIFGLKTLAPDPESMNPDPKH